MSKWLIATIVGTFLAGFMPIFNNKAVKIHGPLANMAILTIFFGSFLAVWFLVHPEQLLLISGKSFVLAIFSGLFSFSSSWLIFCAYKLAPVEKLPIIVLTTGFSIIIAAVVSHFLGQKMELHRWVGAVVAIFGIILVNLDKATLARLWNH